MDVGLYCVRAVRAVWGDLFLVVPIQDLPGWKKAVGEFGDKSVERIADVFQGTLGGNPIDSFKFSTVPLEPLLIVLEEWWEAPFQMEAIM